MSASPPPSDPPATSVSPVERSRDQIERPSPVERSRDQIERSEIPLTGGNMTPVSRSGDTVRRAAGPWTPTIHRLLTHLHDRGIDWLPEPLGIDESGREILSFLPGSVPNYPLPARVWSDAALDTAGWMLRAFHDATLDFDRAGSVWQQPAHEPAEVICHNDFAPYNFVFEGQRLTGVIDWDTASPGPRLWDLAYLAYRLIPLCSEPGTPELDVDSRLARLLRAYGSEATGDQVIAMVTVRLDELAAFSEEQAGIQNRTDLLDHATLYRRDAAALRSR